LDTSPFEPEPALINKVQSEEFEVEQIAPKPSSLENVPMLSGGKKSDTSKEAHRSSKSNRSFEVLGK